jgi:hypothetical protein
MRQESDGARRNAYGVQTERGDPAAALVAELPRGNTSGHSDQPPRGKQHYLFVTGPIIHAGHGSPAPDHVMESRWFDVLALTSATRSMYA